MCYNDLFFKTKTDLDVVFIINWFLKCLRVYAVRCLPFFKLIFIVLRDHSFQSDSDVA